MRWTSWILYGVTLPLDLLVAWPLVVLVRVLWGQDLRWETPPGYTSERGGGGGPCLTCMIREGSYPVVQGRWPKGWYLHKGTARPWGGTTLGHAIFYGPSGRKEIHGWTRTQAHEHVHVEQAEAASVQGFVTGSIVAGVLFGVGHPVLAGVLLGVFWLGGYLFMAGSGWLTAVLRGEDAYWGAAHEESARAQTNLYFSAKP